MRVPNRDTLTLVGVTVLVFRTCPRPDDRWTSELEARGYFVLSAEEPSQALVHVRTKVVDMVIVDAPGDQVASPALARFVAELQSIADAPPFILVSGSPSAPLESARLGAAAFVPEPCTVDEIDGLLSRSTRRAAAPAPKRTRRASSAASAPRAASLLP